MISMALCIIIAALIWKVNSLKNRVKALEQIAEGKQHE